MYFYQWHVDELMQVLSWTEMKCNLKDWEGEENMSNEDSVFYAFIRQYYKIKGKSKSFWDSVVIAQHLVKK